MNNNKTILRMKKSVFFADAGLTSTSANHIANLAKEKVEALRQSLDSADFVNEDLKIITSDVSQRVKNGRDELYVNDIKNKIETIAKANALIAWLREAIKAKDEIFNRLEHIDDYAICNELGIEYPKYPEQKCAMTPEQYYETLNIKERNRYYQLEAFCAAYGKFIHPDGAISKARKNLHTVINEPIKVKEDGANTLIRTLSPSVELKLVEDAYFSLQDDYRCYQAQLNKMKHECEVAVQNSKIETARINKEANEEFAKKTKEISLLCKQWLEEQRKEYSTLKIAIPDSLRCIYESLK
jgi:hypothetical protein